MAEDQFEYGENTLEDDDREYLIDHNFTRTGQIDVGDSIRGHAIWDRLNNNPLNPGQVGGELTSVFQVKVTGKEEVRPGKFNFTFGPDPSFSEAAALGLDGQAMMVFYQDATADAALDYTDPNSPYPPFVFDDGTSFFPANPGDVSENDNKVHEETFIDTATDGDYFWSMGFTGSQVDGAATAGNGEGWATFEPIGDNVLPLFVLPKAIDIEGSAFSLSRLDSPVETGVADGLSLDGQTSQFDSGYEVDFNGKRTWHGVLGTKTAFEIGTNTTLNFAVVPVPPAAAMGLLMLAGMGAEYYRRRKTHEA